MSKTVVLIILFFIAGAFKSKLAIDKSNPAYQIFTGPKAKITTYDKMMKELDSYDVVFFGEIHNNSLCHWLQLQVLKSLNQSDDKEVVLGLEMIESDNQLILDEFLSGTIRENHFKAEARLWDSYKTDYAPLVNFAMKHKFPVIATNIPRRYASLVARKGISALEQLSEEAKRFMAPLPIEVDYDLEGYKELSKMMNGHKGHGMGKNLVDAQAIKDATMAYFIIENISENSVFYHLNGSFHSKNKEGIVHYLQKERPDLSIATIMMVEQEDITKLEESHKQLADYIIAIPSDMTRTY